MEIKNYSKLTLKWKKLCTWNSISENYPQRILATIDFAKTRSGDGNKKIFSILASRTKTKSLDVAQLIKILISRDFKLLIPTLEFLHNTRMNRHGMTIFYSLFSHINKDQSPLSSVG